MNKTPPRIQYVLMRILQRLYRVWVALLIGIVCIPLATVVWYATTQYPATEASDIQLSVLTPANNVQVASAITVAFSRAVDPQQIAAQLVVQPAHAYALEWNATQTQVAIIPTTPWQPDTRYTIALPATATTHAADWHWQFQTEPGLSITAVIPSAGSSAVATTDIIVVRFSQAMVPQSVLNRPTPNTLLTATPPFDGTLTWVDQYTAIVRPVVMTVNTPYTIQVNTDVRDMVGRSLSQPYTWQFQTLVPQLTLVAPATGAQQVALTAPIVFTATGDIDEQALRDSIMLWPATSIRTDISNADNETTQITIVPQPTWQRDTEYRLHIGGGNTQVAYQQLTFRTAPALRLVARSPGEGQIISPNQDVRFIFNATLNPQTLTDTITLIPAPITPATITSSGRDIRIQAKWLPGVNPEIRIDALLQSSTGITLGTVLTSLVMLDHQTNHVALPLTNQDIIDATQNAPLIVTSSNIQNLIIRVYDLAPSALVHILGMDADTLAQIVPERYELPVLHEAIIPQPAPKTVVTLPTDLVTRIQSKLVLLIASDEHGHRDVRLVRLLPPHIQIAQIGGAIAIGSQERGVLTSTVELFTNGQMVEQGLRDEQGIWLSQRYPRGGTFIVLDNTSPSDVARIVVPETVVDQQQVTLLSDQRTVTPGSRMSFVVARNSGQQFTQVIPVSLCRSDGVLLASQNIIYAPGQTLSSGKLDIPNQIAYGTYHLCIRTPTITAETPLIVHAPRGERLRLQWNRDNGTIIGRLSDAAAHTVYNATIYWMSGMSVGTTTTAIDGAFRINTDNSAPLTIVAIHQGESSVSNVDALITRTIAISTPVQWVRPGSYSQLTIQIIDPEQRNLSQRVQLVVRNQTGYTATRASIRTDNTGKATVQLAIPRGLWQVEASDGNVTQRMPLRVGGTSERILIAQDPIIPVSPLLLWVGDPSPTPLLLAQHDASGTHVHWTTPNQGVITTTVPITSTFVQLAIPQLGTTSAPVQATDCTTFAVTTDVVRNGSIPITVTTSPDVDLALRLIDQSTGNTVAWQPALHANADGNVVVPIPDNGTSKLMRIDAIVSQPFCSHAHHHDFVVQRAQSLRLDAPMHTRIGDEVVVDVTLNDQLPRTLSYLTATITNALVLDAPASPAITSDQTGNATARWRIKVTHADPQLLIRSASGAHVVWNPVVDEPVVYTRNDGFFLDGRTQINIDSPAPQVDVLRQQREVLYALRADRIDVQNPSQIAHLILFSEQDERIRLLALLDRMRNQQPAWGWGEPSSADVLITADVVSALARAGVTRTAYQDALPWLRTQLADTQIPASIRVLMMRALVLSGDALPPEFTAIGDQLSSLGNEGLAAYLALLPSDQAYRIPEVMALLLERRHTTPRGSYWDEDPATHMLHNRDSVNALLLQSFIAVSVNREIQQAVITYLVGTRGVAGWGDAISNARMWEIRDQLFDALDGSQQTDIQLQPDALLQNRPVWPPLQLQNDITIATNAPVLVGISHADEPPATRNDMIIDRNYALLDGTPLNSESQLSVNDYVNGTLDIVTFAGMNYLRITDPLIQIGQIEFITPPQGFTVMVDPNNRIMLYGNTTRAGVWRCQYRMRITHSGNVFIPAAVAHDAAGTIHARSQATTITVAAP